MALLDVKNLSVRFPVRTPWFQPRRYLNAVNQVSFALDKGETIGLVGESGCGKSTLGRALVRIEEPYEGSINLDGLELTALHGRALRKVRRRFQMIFQDPYGSLNPRLSIRSAIEEVLKIHFKYSAQERRDRVAELLTQVGLVPDLMERYPHQFSGGQRQRIGIARALAAQPDFIVADEPVSALDVSVQASIVNLLAEIQQTSGTSFLFIAHDLAVVEHLSQRIMVMYLGFVVESGPAHEVVASPLHPYTRALLEAVPGIDGKLRKKEAFAGEVPSPLALPVGCPFHTRCPLATEECRRKRPELKNHSGGHCCACFHAGA